VICASTSSGAILLKAQITEITGILMDGKMSFGVLRMERTPAIKMKIPRTMKV
jgi:hypothetical protein